MSGLRVIAGAAKGRKLKMPPGEGTRPVMDRVKEAVFNILAEDIIEATFLDLFAGSGGVGIEALDRLAKGQSQPAAWTEEKEKILAEAAKPAAHAELAVLTAITKLVEACAGTAK